MKKTGALASSALLVAVLGACGSGSPSSSRGTRSPSSAARNLPGPRIYERNFGDSNPANANPSGQPLAYTPTGQIVATDGFDPTKNGFAFQNYGNILQDGTAATNMTSKEMQDEFGNAVCGDPQCDLTPGAQAYLTQTNQQMAGGHCYGFSVTALKFFSGKADPTTFGAASTSQLGYAGNTSLQSFIAESFSYQRLPSVLTAAVKADPIAIVDKLKAVLTQNPSETYTLGIFQANGTGGHAITPYAVEDNGGGMFHILVYDNNFPNTVRAVTVDENADTWTYDAAINPTQPTQVYNGDHMTNPMQLLPTGPGLGIQPLPFANTSSTGSGSANQSSATWSGAHTTPAYLVDDTTGQRYEDVYLNGGDIAHGHLRITNGQGEVVGYQDGKLIDTIPGAIVERPFEDEDYAESNEPEYLVPAGQTYTVRLSGVPLTSQDKEDVGVIAPGFESEIDNIDLHPGEIDTIGVDADGAAVTYTSSAAQRPVVTYGVSDAHNSYDLEVSGDTVPANGTIGVKLPPGSTDFTFSPAATGGATNTLSLYLDKEDQSGSHEFAHEGVSVADGDSATLRFGGWTVGDSIPLDITHDGQIRTEQLGDQDGDAQGDLAASSPVIGPASTDQGDQGDQSGPGSATSEDQGDQSGPGSATTDQGDQPGPGSATTDDQSPGPTSTDQGDQSGPGSATTDQGDQSGPGSDTTDQGTDPGSDTTDSGSPSSDP